MDFVLVVLGIVVVAGALYFVATGLFGPGEPPPPSGAALASPLPDDRDLTAGDLRAATFPVTARGYRMADVDKLLERLAQQLAAAENQPGERAALADLTAQAYDDADFAPPTAPPSAPPASQQRTAAEPAATEEPLGAQVGELHDKKPTPAHSAENDGDN